MKTSYLKNQCGRSRGRRLQGIAGISFMLALAAASARGAILYDAFDSPIGPGCGGSYADSALAETDGLYGNAASYPPLNYFKLSKNIEIGKSVWLSGHNPVALAGFTTQSILRPEFQRGGASAPSFLPAGRHLVSHGRLGV